MPEADPGAAGVLLADETFTQPGVPTAVPVAKDLDQPDVELDHGPFAEPLAEDDPAGRPPARRADLRAAPDRQPLRRPGVRPGRPRTDHDPDGHGESPRRRSSTRRWGPTPPRAPQAKAQATRPRTWCGSSAASVLHLTAVGHVIGYLTNWFAFISDPGPGAEGRGEEGQDQAEGDEAGRSDPVSRLGGAETPAAPAYHVCMKLCISQATTLPAAFADDLAAFADVGWPAAELWLTKLEKHLESASVEDTANVRSKTATSTRPRPPTRAGCCCPRANSGKAHFDHFRRRLELCQALGVPTLLLVADFAHRPDATALQRAVVSLAQAAPVGGRVRRPAGPGVPRGRRLLHQPGHGPRAGRRVRRAERRRLPGPVPLLQGAEQAGGPGRADAREPGASCSSATWPASPAS